MMQVLIEKATSGVETLTLAVNGRRYAVYSSHDPERDGMRYFGQYADKPGEICIFIGLGLAYHILPFEKIREGTGGIKQIVVLEPDEDIFTSVRSCPSIKRLLQIRTVRLYVGDEVRRFIKDINTRYEYLFYRSVQVLSYPALKKIFREQYEDLEGCISKSLDDLAADGMTIARFARIWINNYCKNSGVKNAMPVSDLYSRHAGNTLITGAGPSLDDALEKLTPLRNRFFIIAVDASVKPLMQHRIRPDLIVTVDPQASVFYHFCGLGQEDVNGIPAVMSFLSYPQVFDFFAEKYIFHTKHPLSLPQAGGNDDMINHRAVSSVAFELACRMGFTSIQLAGLDFSYPGFRVYARNAFFYEYAAGIETRLITAGTAEGRLIRRNAARNIRFKAGTSAAASDDAADENGSFVRPITSTYNLESYKSELEAVIEDMKRRMGVEVFNWYSSGRRIRGAAVEKGTDLSEGFAKGFKKTSADVKRHRVTSVLPSDIRPSSGRAEQLKITLSLRYRLFKHAAGFDEAMKYADIYLYKRFGWQ